MTWEFHRHMKPDKTMVIVIPNGRGQLHLDRFVGTPGHQVNVQHGMNDAINPDRIRRWCVGLDVVYAAETFYREDVADILRGEGVRTVLHAMPELWRADMAKPDQVWLPTKWEADRIPEAQIMPVPVATDRFGPPHTQARGEPLRLLFVGAPAFHDRNGFNLAVDAIAAVNRPVVARFVGSEEPPQIYNRRAKVDVEWHPQARDNYWDGYDQADVLLLPRRYAGLSLPMQEAAAAGLPIVTLDLAPQNGWVPDETMAAASVYRTVRMVGGEFPVHAADPGQIAKAIDWLADPEHYDWASKVSRYRADVISWAQWEPRYREALSLGGSA